MTIQYFWRHPLAEQVREEGRVEVLAEMVLHILGWRGISVQASARKQVMACRDRDQLTAWAQRAVHATDDRELFVDE